MRRQLPRLSILLVLGASVCSLPSTVHAQHPTHPAGFSPEKAYQVGLVDNVDLFSGTLGLSLPVGPLTLTYSSSALWTYETVDLFFIKADAHKKSNAGFGWRLGFGDVYHKNHWYNGAGRWQFIDEMGGSHIFNSDLHHDEDDGDPDVSYSRDNTYLRFRVINDWNVEIEYPDGTIRQYKQPPGWGEQAPTFHEAVEPVRLRQRSRPRGQLQLRSGGVDDHGSVRPHPHRHLRVRGTQP